MWGHCCCWFAGGFGRLWAREFQDNNKQIIICYSGGSKDQNAKRNVDSEGQACRISDDELS